MIPIKNYDFVLDLTERSVIHRMEFYSGSHNASTMTISLTNNHEPVNLTNTVIEILYDKPDKTQVINTNIEAVPYVEIIDFVNGIVQITLTTQALASKGRVKAQIKVIDGEDTSIYPEFTFTVGESIDDTNTIVSSNEMPLLEDLIGGYATAQRGLAYYDWTYTAPSDNITSFAITSSDFNPAKDQVDIYDRNGFMYPNINYTRNNSVVTLTDYTLNTGGFIFCRILKDVIKVQPKADGSMLEDNSVGKVKLTQDIQNDLNSVGDRNYNGITENTLSEAIKNDRTRLADIPNQIYITEKAKIVDVNNALALKSDKTTTDALQNIKADKTYVDNQVQAVASGSPKPVTLVSQMIDTTKAYVYTGAESGYTAGHWYYYNGSAWTDGGAYQSTGIADNGVDLNNMTDIIKTSLAKGILNGDLITYPLNPKLGMITGAGVFSTASLFAVVITDIIPNGNDIIIKFNKPYNWRKRTWNTSGTMNGTFETGTSQTIVLSKYQTNVSKYALEVWGVNDAWGTIYTNSFLVDVRNNMLTYSDVKLKFYKGQGISGSNGTNTFYLMNLNATTGCISSVFNCKANMIIRNKRPDLYKLWVYANQNGTSYFDYLGSKPEYDLAKYVGMDAFIEIRHLSDNVYSDGMAEEVLNVFDISYKHKYDSQSDLTFYKGLFKNVVCCGDSLTEGDQGSGGEINRITSFNYPYFLRQITNWNVTNAGSSGITTITYWNTIASGGQDADVTIGTGQKVHRFIPASFATYDTLILYLGTNGGLTDTIDTDCVGASYLNYANTNTGDYCKIIEKAKADNPSIKIILVKIWTGADPVGVTTTNAVIDKIAAKYNLFTIESNNPQFTDLTNKVYHPYDIHMSNIGYLNFANYVLNEMCKICAVNESYFQIIAT